MKFIKKNFKIILAFFLGIILAGGVSIYAAIQYNASDVRYVKEGQSDANWIPVNEALDELYRKKNNIVLVGHGEAKIQTTTSLVFENVPSYVDDGSVLEIDNNNVFTTKKSGRYLFIYAAGSNIATATGGANTVYLRCYVDNGDFKDEEGKNSYIQHEHSYYSVYASCSQYSLNYYICNVDAGKTIYATAASDGGNIPQKALYKVYYIKNSEDNVSNNITNITSDNIAAEQIQRIDGTSSSGTYTATQDELLVICLSETGYHGYSNNITTTGTIIKDTNNLNTSAYATEVQANWSINIRTVIVKLKKDDTLTISSYGKGYGSGQYSITHIK